MDGFMAALQAAQVSQSAYVATLPQWVPLWMNWMGIVLALGSIVFSFFKVEARWLLLAFAVSIVATFALGMTIGWNGLWGTTHLVFWTPAAVYMYRRLEGINTNSVYGVWYLLALATVIISLVFDAKDAVQYLVA
mgnify:FL=1|tara:strand:+ start:1153 stop:1557 length:405 start_codon:yes stop_codon:yes gene_type:complete